MYLLFFIPYLAMLPVKTDEPNGLSRLCPGARRSFFCRMKCKATADTVKEESEASSVQSTPVSSSPSSSSTKCNHQRRRKSATTNDKKYCVIQCTGYLKSWAPSKIGLEEHESDVDHGGDSSNITCLVAIGRMPPDIFEPGAAPLPSTSHFLHVRSIQFTSRHGTDGKFLFVDQRFVVFDEKQTRLVLT